MLDQIKKKRLSLTHQFGLSRPRISSLQRRKIIQANLQQFKKDIKQSRQSSPIQSSKKIQSDRQLNQTPTMKDLINPFIRTANQLRKKSQDIDSPRFKMPEDVAKEQQQSKNQQRSQIQQNSSINNNSSSIPQQTGKFQLHPPQQPQQNKKEHQQPIPQQNKSNQSIKPSLNKYDDSMQLSNLSQQKPIQNLQKKVAFGTPRNKDLQKSKQKDNPSLQPSYKNKQDQLHFNYNQSKYGGGSSSEGSSAIFFTSQFRQFINRDNDNQQVPPIPQQQNQQQNQNNQELQPITQKKHLHTHNNSTDKQVDQSFLKIGDQDQYSSMNQSRTKKLQHIQSGKSLAFSNNDQSLLRYSKANESALHDIVHRKFDEELVMEIQQFGKNQFMVFCQNYRKQVQKFVCKTATNDLVLLKKLSDIKYKNDLDLKRYCFDGFLIAKQYKFDKLKNQIKADNYLKQVNQKLLKKIFDQWKKIPIQNQKKAIIKSNQREEKMKKNIFQVFKIIWYDSKVKNQIDLYYLSKIFSSLRAVCSKQRKKSQALAMKQYCRSLKRTYFNKIQQGVQAMRQQRLNQQLAQNHYQFVTLKNCFDSWLEQCDKSPQYISLTMTSKNVFKQTQDNKWLGIKTVDFKQIRP